MFELADRLVGIYKTDNCTKSVTLNPHLLEEAVAPPSQPNLTVIQPSPAKTVSRSVMASVQLLPPIRYFSPGPVHSPASTRWERATTPWRLSDTKESQYSPVQIPVQ